MRCGQKHPIKGLGLQLIMDADNFDDTWSGYLEGAMLFNNIKSWAAYWIDGGYEKVEVEIDED